MFPHLVLAHGQAAAEAHEAVIYRVEFVWGVHDSLIVASSARAAKREVTLLCLPAAADDGEILRVHLPKTQWDGQLMFLTLRPARRQSQLGLCGQP